MVYKKVFGFLMVAVMISATLYTYAVHSNSRTNVENLQQTEWLFDESTTDPTDPGNYTMYTDAGGLNALCEKVSGICGIIAPVDPTSSPTNPKPLIDEGLEDRIGQEDDSHDDVFLSARTS